MKLDQAYFKLILIFPFYSLFSHVTLIVFFNLGNVINCKSIKLRQYCGMTEEVTTGVINTIIIFLSSQTIYSEPTYRTSTFTSIRPSQNCQLIQILWIIFDYRQLLTKLSVIIKYMQYNNPLMFFFNL